MENNKLFKEFDPNSQDKIKLPKETNIFIEVKSYIDSQSVINFLIKTSKEFANAYDHLTFDGIELKENSRKAKSNIIYFITIKEIVSI